MEDLNKTLLSDLSSDLEGTAHRINSMRNILCVYPRYARSFGTFHYAYPLMPGVKAFMPPQGLLVIAAYLPRQWHVRIVDESVRPAKDDDYEWADAVLMSGTHTQRLFIDEINRKAHAYGKLTVLGGPSASASPEYYPDIDVLHIGELGDATDALIERLDRNVERPARQIRLETRERESLEDFPIPAYESLDALDYFLNNVQFSSGCQYRCEFCDIPELYGRAPRVKTPKRLLTELDRIVENGARGAIYFVDDNFIANRRATKALLKQLVAWQRSRGYPIQFACEATLNLAQHPDILELMREAVFHTVFCGIESPEPSAIKAIRKQQNLRIPVLESIQTMNRFGLEVVAGIILGFDTDTPETVDRIIEFIKASQIPLLTINLLYALPKTPLYRRLESEGRLDPNPARVSNVRFRLPYQTVIDMWLRCLAEAYSPERLMSRLAYQTRETYPNRITPRRKVSPSLVLYGLRILARVLWQVGLRSAYKRSYWKVCAPLLRSGRIEELLHIGIVSKHLIRFTQDCLSGRGEASFYADPNLGRRRTVDFSPSAIKFRAKRAEKNVSNLQSKVTRDR